VYGKSADGITLKFGGEGGVTISKAKGKFAPVLMQVPRHKNFIA